MIEKVISLYWEAREKDAAVLFVKEVLARGIAYSDDHKEEHKGGPTGYLAWKMMVIVICFQPFLFLNLNGNRILLEYIGGGHYLK